MPFGRGRNFWELTMFQTKRPNLTEDIMPENIVIKLVVIQYANGKFDGRSYQNGELNIGNNYFVHRRGFEGYNPTPS